MRNVIILHGAVMCTSRCVIRPENLLDSSILVTKVHYSQRRHYVRFVSPNQLTMTISRFDFRWSGTKLCVLHSGAEIYKIDRYDRTDYAHKTKYV